MKKLTKLTLATLLVASMLFGCMSLSLAEAATPLRIFFQQEPQVLDYVDNKLTHHIEEQFNVKIEWDLVLGQDKTQKLNLILATQQNLPDVFMGGMDTSTVVEYGSQGTLIPLNDYIENNSVYFKKVMEIFPDLAGLMTAPDGNIYALPNINMSQPNMVPSRLWINKVWLDNLGLTVPTTTEELKAVLEAFKTKDPNGNNLADEIPLIGANTGWSTLVDTFLMNAFLQYPTDGASVSSRRYTVADGKITPVYNNDGYKAGLKYLNELVTAGLLDPASYTQDANQLKQLFENPDIAIVGALTAGGPNTFANMTGSDRFRDYIALTPIKGPDGVQLTAYNPFGYFNAPNCWVITSECKNPELAFSIADAFFSEELSMWGRLGEPGVDYIPNPEGKTAVDGGEALFEAILVYGSEQNAHWQNRNPYYNFFDNKGVASEDPYTLQDLLWNVTQEYFPFTPATETCLPPLIYTPEEAAELNGINAVLAQYIDEMRVQMITGGNIDAVWDSYIAELSNIGLERLVEIMQQAYDRFAAA